MAVDRMDPSNYGPGKYGEHITWLGQRLVLHGFGKYYRSGPGPRWGEADRFNVRDFQLAQGWTGSGADGYPGRITLSRLAQDPVQKLPAQVLNLKNWKLTLPEGEDESPTEIKQPALNTFIDPDHFFVRNGAVVFRAEVEGVTTSGSSYPRTELREMVGTGLAGWSSGSGTHVMTITQTITKTPIEKPDVVAGQIHDASDDVVMIRLEGDRLFVESRGREMGDLYENYVLGAEFTVTITADRTGIEIRYNNSDPVEVPGVFYKCYFKAGCYTQSNLNKGDKAGAYGEVVIHNLTVVHS